MNPKLFLGFDISSGSRTTSFTPDAAAAQYVWTKEFMLPSGVFQYVKKYYDSIGSVYADIQTYTAGILPGRTSNSYSYGGSGFIASFSRVFSLNTATHGYGGPGLFFNKSGYGITNKVYYSCDYSPGTTANVTSDFAVGPLNNEGYAAAAYHSLTGNSILRFGGCSVRYLGYSGHNNSTADLYFGLYNNNKFVQRLDVIGKANNQFAFLKAAILLDATTGFIDLTVDGQNANYIGNTLSGITDTNHAWAQEIHFGPAYHPANNYGNFSRIDNCYFSTEGYPAGRPKAERLFWSGDRNNNGWLSFNAFSMASGVSPSGTGYISGALGATIELYTQPYTRTASDIYLGMEVGLLGLNNNDLVSGRRIKVDPLVQTLTYPHVESGTALSNSMFRTFLNGQRFVSSTQPMGYTGFDSIGVKLTVI